MTEADLLRKIHIDPDAAFRAYRRAALRSRRAVTGFLGWLLDGCWHNDVPYPSFGAYLCSSRYCRKCLRWQPGTH